MAKRNGFKNGGHLHKLWFRWMENYFLMYYKWPWRPICWIYGHDHDWNYGRTYCVICDKTISKDAWQIKRDQERKK